MVSRRMFISISAMMAIIFFLFQFLQVYKQSENVYNVNEYVTQESLSGQDKWQSSPMTPSGEEARDYILFLGAEGSDTAQVVEQWCLYTKREMVSAALLKEAKEALTDRDRLPKLLVVEQRALTENAAWSGKYSQADKLNLLAAEREFLTEMTQEGVSVILCGLPDVSMLEGSRAWKELLGLERVEAKETTVKGIQLFSGFLFGGEAVFEEKESKPGKESLQDLELTMPWYVTGKGTKTYMVGLFDEEVCESEDFPAIIWRNRWQKGFIFAINGEYMSGLTGLGILSACEYENEEYIIYPVVNARNILLSNSPVLSDENEATLMEIYSRNLNAVQRDVMWPGITALASRNHLKLTCFITPQYDYTDEKEPDARNLVYYLQQMKEVQAEAGKTLTYQKAASLTQKLQQDSKLWSALDEGYQYRSYFSQKGVTQEVKEALQSGILSEVQTIAGYCDKTTPLLSYCEDEITLQGITHEATDYTYSQELSLRSIMTALGYSNVLIDMERAVWPQSGADEWQNYFKEVSSNVDTYWSRYEIFDATTLTQSDQRVRSFLNLDYIQSREENVITLQTEGYGREAWFLLRTHGEEVTSQGGAEIYEVEEDAYLIRVFAPTAKLSLTQIVGNW